MSGTSPVPTAAPTGGSLLSSCSICASVVAPVLMVLLSTRSPCSPGTLTDHHQPGSGFQRISLQCGFFLPVKTVPLNNIPLSLHSTARLASHRCRDARLLAFPIVQVLARAQDQN